MESKLRLSTGQCAKMLQMQECPQSNGYRQLSRAGMERSSEDNCLAPDQHGLQVSGCCSCLWSLWSMYSLCPSALWPLHKSLCEGQLVQGQVLHFTSPHLEMTPVLRVIPQTQERGVSQQLGAAFPTHTDRRSALGTNSQMWSKTTGWANSSHPAEAQKPETWHFSWKWDVQLERAVLNVDFYHWHTGNSGSKYPIFTGDLLSCMITEPVRQRWWASWVQSLYLSVWERFILAHQKKRDRTVWLDLQ